MAKLERLREEVVEKGIIPRRLDPKTGEPTKGLPTEVYYLKVKELAALVEDPSLAEDFIKRARIRSRKRRRKSHLKKKAMDTQFQPPGSTGGGHTNRLREVLPADKEVECLGKFTWHERFISETGFGKAKAGYVYRVMHRRILLTESEAERAHLEFGIPVKHLAYTGIDLQKLIGESEDRLYREQMGK